MNRNYSDTSLTMLMIIFKLAYKAYWMQKIIMDRNKIEWNKIIKRKHVTYWNKILCCLPEILNIENVDKAAIKLLIIFGDA